MKTVLVLSILLCAAFAAPVLEAAAVPESPAEEKDKKAPEAAVEVLKEQPVDAPAPVLEEAAAPESRFNFCPTGWFGHGSRCFLFVNSPMNWYNAEEHCNNLGANLASVSNPREYSFLQQLTQAAGQTTAWLGGFSLQNRWMWINREGFYYANWYSQVSSSSYPCAYLRTTNGWGNSQCATFYRFICSKNPVSC